MIKQILENIDESSISVPKRPPRGYKHFDNKRQEKELEKYLLTLTDTEGNTLFTKKELSQIKNRRDLITKRVVKTKNREGMDYINYVYNFGLEDEVPHGLPFMQGY